MFIEHMPCLVNDKIVLEADYNIFHSVTCTVGILLNTRCVVLAIKNLCFRIHNIYSS